MCLFVVKTKMKKIESKKQFGERSPKEEEDIFITLVIVYLARVGT